MGATIDPCGTPFLRRSNLLCFLTSAVRVKLQLQTSFMINETMCLSRRRQGSLQQGCELELELELEELGNFGRTRTRTRTQKIKISELELELELEKSL